MYWIWKFKSFLKMVSQHYLKIVHFKISDFKKEVTFQLAQCNPMK